MAIFYAKSEQYWARFVQSYLQMQQRSGFYNHSVVYTRYSFGTKDVRTCGAEIK